MSFNNELSKSCLKKYERMRELAERGWWWIGHYFFICSLMSNCKQEKFNVVLIKLHFLTLPQVPPPSKDNKDLF